MTMWRAEYLMTPPDPRHAQAVAMWSWYYALTEVFDVEHGVRPGAPLLSSPLHRLCSDYARTLATIAMREVYALGLSFEESIRARSAALEAHERALTALGYPERHR